MKMEKIDYKRKLKELYSASAKKPEIVDVPIMNFLMIDGVGDPNKAPEFHEAIEALYSVSYTLKFMVKKEGFVDYVVPPLEGLWWADNLNEFTAGNMDKWKWTLMIMQPEYVTEDLVKEAMEQVEKKKDLPALAKLRFEALSEGKSSQIMHIGPYSEELPTIQKLHEFVKEQGFELHGKHHEIYLSDPRKSAPEKMKTILRHPVH